MANEKEVSEKKVVDDRVIAGEKPLTPQECFQLALQEYSHVIQQAFPLASQLSPKAPAPTKLAPSIQSGIDAVFLCACIGFLNLLVAKGQENLSASRKLLSFVPKEKVELPSLWSQEKVADDTSAVQEADCTPMFPKKTATPTSIPEWKADVVSSSGRGTAADLSIQQLLAFSSDVIAARRRLMGKTVPSGGEAKPFKQPPEDGLSERLYSLVESLRERLTQKSQERTLRGAYDGRKEDVFAVVEAELDRLRKKIQ